MVPWGGSSCRGISRSPSRRDRIAKRSTAGAIILKFALASGCTPLKFVAADTWNENSLGINMSNNMEQEMDNHEKTRRMGGAKRNPSSLFETFETGDG